MCVCANMQMFNQLMYKLYANVRMCKYADDIMINSGV